MSKAPLFLKSTLDISSCIRLEKSSEICILFRGLKGLERRLHFRGDIYKTRKAKEQNM